MKNAELPTSYKIVTADKEEIRATVTRSPDAGEVLRPLVIVNGWCGSIASMRDLSSNLVQAAMDVGDHDLAVITYDDRVTGTDAYSQEHKTKRFLDIARIFRGDLPVHALGYSRGWLSVIGAAQALIDEGTLSLAVGLTPVGLQPPRTRKQIVADMFREVKPGPGRTRNAVGNFALFGFLSHIAPHVLANPRGTVNEVADILNADVIEKTVAVSQQIPTGIIRAVDDYAISNHIDAEALRDRGFDGPIESMGGNHVGVSGRAPSIYRTILETEMFTPRCVAEER